MTVIAKCLYLLALAVWVGGTAFLWGAVAPTALRALSAEDTSRLMRKLAARCYPAGVVCAAVGIVCVGLLLADNAFSAWPAILSLLLLAGAGATTALPDPLGVQPQGASGHEGRGGGTAVEASSASNTCDTPEGRSGG